MKTSLLSFLFVLFISSVFAQNNLVQSGPMLGYCEMREALIWLQTSKKASVQIHYYALDNPNTINKSKIYNTSNENGFTCHIILDKIEPGKKYSYNVLVDNNKVVLPYETSFTSKKLWQHREDAPNFKLAFGSCNYINEPQYDRPGKGYGSNYSIFEAIYSKSPDLMIWGGDNVYLREADWDSKTGIYKRYTHSRSVKEMQPLLAKTQNFAIWDDHDFGPNDSDRSFYYKHLTQQAFKDFWANKTYGSNYSQNEGVYSTYSWSDVQFFFLDNRFFKSPNDRKTGEKTVLGNEQFEWLIDALSSSNANFKVIVIGGQVLNTSARFENYETYPEEKQKLLNEIKNNNIKGVLFLTGDRHFAELSKLERENLYPIYDWTVSPLTSGIATTYKDDTNTLRVEGSFFAGNNFGFIEFSGNKDNRKAKLILFDKTGKELWNKEIYLKEIQ